MPGAPPLRILLACARPLLLKVERWQVELSEPASAHREAAGAAMSGLVDAGPVKADGRTLYFDVYPPGPPADAIRTRLAQAVPLTSVSVRTGEIRLPVHRAGEELAALREALEGMEGVEVYVHPAATPSEILEFLQDHDVDVLHLAMHGGKEGGLYFEDGRGAARRVTPEELARLVRGRVRLLCVGACYSANAVVALFPGTGAGEPAAGMAEATGAEATVATAVAAAVAVDGDYPIQSRAMQRFARSFYAGLSRGRDVATSFANGVAAVRADDLVGERGLPDGADEDMPSPWKRFVRFGDGSQSWPDRRGTPGTRDTRAGDTSIRVLVPPTAHRKLPRTDELFVGRSVEVVATVEALEAPRAGIKERKPRVVTLHGEGGIGKTRLAGAVAEWLAERGRYPAGIVEVDCERPGSAAELAVAILDALGVERAESLPDPAGALAELLGRDSQPRLLVLDNLDALFARNGAAAGETAPESPPEPAAAHPGSLLKRCLAAAPGLRILATCRWPLHLGSDENAFEVEPLGRDEAEELFVLSVHHQDIREGLLALSESRRRARLAGILEATERMPLALVLAARRLTDPGQSLETTIRQASEDLLTLCQDERLSHLPPRLRSVRASLDLSYARLSEPARMLFGRVSCFPSGLRRAFEPLAEILGEDWRRLMHEELAEFALARYDRDADRYTLLHPVQAYARQKLDEGEGNAFRRQVTEFWTAFAGSYVLLLAPSQLNAETLAALQLPADPDARQEALEERRQWAFDQLSDEGENIVEAARWALAAGEPAGDRLVRAINPYLNLRAAWRTQEQLAGLAAGRAARAGEVASSHSWQGHLAIALTRLHRWGEALATYGQSLTGFRRLAAGDPDAYLPDVAMTLNNLGNLLANLGERAAARTHYDEALALYWPFFQQYPGAFGRNVVIVLNGLRRVYGELGLEAEAQQCAALLEQLTGGGGDSEGDAPQTE